MECIEFKPDHSLRLNIRKSAAGKPFREHTHDCTELTIVTRGTALHSINGRPHLAKAGDIYVIRPGVSHGFSETSNFVHYVFSYMSELLDSIGSDLRQISSYQTLFALGHSPANSQFDAMLCLSFESLSKVESLMEATLAELAAKQPGYESLAKARFVEIVTLLVREHMSQGPRGGTPLDVERAAKLASRMEGRFSEDFDLALAAKELGVSDRQMRRIFQKHYGVPPIEYLMRLRISRAGTLLDSSDMTVSEVAFACGFSDSNYFSRQFRSSTGLSPREWRNCRRG